MPKYLWQRSYTPEGIRGSLKEGASSRVAELRGVAERGGGKIEAIYWAFCESDLYIVGEAPRQRRGGRRQLGDDGIGRRTGEARRAPHARGVRRRGEAAGQIPTTKELAASL
jgi:uncharacterized protein with GYD domain